MKDKTQDKAQSPKKNPIKEKNNVEFDDLYAGLDFESMPLRKKYSIACYRIQNMVKTKSGHNDLLNYNYFTLDDMLPAIYKIGAEMGLMYETVVEESKISFIISNADKDDDRTIKFDALLKPVQVRGGNAMQAQGSSITYARRLLFLIAFGIAEEEQYDKIQGNPDYTVVNNTASKTNKVSDENKDKSSNPMTFEQYSSIVAIFKKLFGSEYPEIKDQAVKTLKDYRANNLKDIKTLLDGTTANEVIRKLNNVEKQLKSIEQNTEKTVQDENIQVNNNSKEVEQKNEKKDEKSKDDENYAETLDDIDTMSLPEIDFDEKNIQDVYDSGEFKLFDDDVNDDQIEM